MAQPNPYTGDVPIELNVGGFAQKAPPTGEGAASSMEMSGMSGMSGM